MKRSLIIAGMLVAVAASCTIIMDDTSISEKSRQEKTFPDEQATQTNTIIMTNSQLSVTNIVTNTVVVVYTNTIETVVTNLVLSNTTISNWSSITNIQYQIITNTTISNAWYTNTLIQTNEYYYTNTVLSNVDNAIFVLLTAPGDGAYLADSFTVNGYTPDGGDLAGAMIYIESTNEVMVQAQYSGFSGTSFSSTIRVDKEGHYYLWASAWDNGNAIGRSDKHYIIADWSAPQVHITTVNGAVFAGNVTITGTAYDRVSGLQGVYLSVDGGGYSGVNGLSEWSYSTTLAPGSHSISVYSRDAAGYVSLSESIVVNVE